MKRKIISLVLAMVMILTNVPAAFAAGGPDGDPPQGPVLGDETGGGDGEPGDGQPAEPGDGTGGGSGGGSGEGSGEGSGDGSQPTDPGDGGGNGGQPANPGDGTGDDDDDGEPGEGEELEEPEEPALVEIMPLNNFDLEITAMDAQGSPGGIVRLNIDITKNLSGVSRINALQIYLGSGLQLYMPKGRDNFDRYDSSTWPYIPGDLLPVLGNPDIPNEGNGYSGVIYSNGMTLSFQKESNVYGTGRLVTLLLQVEGNVDIGDEIDVTLVCEEKWGYIDGGSTSADFLPELVDGVVTIVEIAPFDVSSAEELKIAMDQINRAGGGVFEINLDNSIHYPYDIWLRDDKDVTINLNGSNLTVEFERQDWYEAIRLSDGAKLTVNGPGTLNAIGDNGIGVWDDGSEFTAAGDVVVHVRGNQGSSAYAHDEGVLTVSNPGSSFHGSVNAQDGGEITISGDVVSYDNTPAYASNGGSVTINGNVTCDNNGDYFFPAAYASGGGSITITGNVSNTDGNGINVNDTGSEITVNGNITSGTGGGGVYADRGTATVTGSITSPDGSAVQANRGATVNVTGNVTAKYNGVYSGGNGTSVNVTGNVTSTEGSAVRADRGASAAITGTVKGLDTGACAEGPGSAVTVTGDVEITGDWGRAVSAESGGTVTVKRNAVTQTGGDATAQNGGDAVWANGFGSLAVIEGNARAKGNGSTYIDPWNGERYERGGAGARAVNGGRIEVALDVTTAWGEAAIAESWWGESSGSIVIIGGNAEATGEWGSAALADGAGNIVKVGYDKDGNPTGVGKGNATGRGGGAEARWGGRVEVRSNASGGISGTNRDGTTWGGSGAMVWGYGSTVEVGGNATAQGTWTAGAEAREGVVIVRGDAKGTGRYGNGADAIDGGTIYIYGDIERGPDGPDIGLGWYDWVDDTTYMEPFYKDNPTKARTVLRAPFDGFYWKEFNNKDSEDRQDRWYPVSYVYMITDEEADTETIPDINGPDALEAALATIDAAESGIFVLNFTAGFTFTEMIYINGNKIVTFNLNGFNLTAEYDPTDENGWEGAIELSDGAYLLINGPGTLEATGGTGVNAFDGSELDMDGGAIINVHGTFGSAAYAESGSAVKVTNATTQTGLIVNTDGELGYTGSGVYAFDNSTINVAGNAEGGWTGARAEWGSTVTVGGNVMSNGNAADSIGWGSKVTVDGNATAVEGDGIAARAEWEGEVYIKGNATSENSWGAEAVRGGKVYVAGEISGGTNDVTVGDWAFWDDYESDEDVKYFNVWEPSRRGAVPDAPYDTHYWDEFSNDDMWDYYDEEYYFMPSYVYKRRDVIPPNTYAGIDDDWKLARALSDIRNKGAGTYTIEIAGDIDYEYQRWVEFYGGFNVTINLNGHRVHFYDIGIELGGGAKLTVNDSAGWGVLNIFNDGIRAEDTGSAFMMAGNAQVNVLNSEWWRRAVEADDGGQVTVSNVTAERNVAVTASNGSAVTVTEDVGSGSDWTGIFASNSTVTVGGDVNYRGGGSSSIEASWGSVVTVRNNIHSNGRTAIDAREAAVTVGGSIYSTEGSGIEAEDGSAVTVRGEIYANSDAGITARNYGTTVAIHGDIHVENTHDDGWGYGVNAAYGAKVYVYSTIYDATGVDGGHIRIGDWNNSEPPEGYINISVYDPEDENIERGVLLDPPHHGYEWDKYYYEDERTSGNDVWNGDYWEWTPNLSYVYKVSSEVSAAETYSVGTAEELWDALTGGYRETIINITANIDANYSEEVVIQRGREVTINLGSYTVSINNASALPWASAMELYGDGTLVTVNGTSGSLTLNGNQGLGVYMSEFNTAGGTVNVNGRNRSGVYVMDGGTATVTNASSGNGPGAHALEGTITVTNNVTSGNRNWPGAAFAETVSEWSDENNDWEWTDRGGTVHVGGDVTGAGWAGAYAHGPYSLVTVGGSAYNLGEPGAGARADDGGTTRVEGNAESDNGEAAIAEWGGKTYVGEDAITTSQWGAAAYVAGEGSYLEIGGDATGVDTGAMTQGGGEIVIEGDAKGDNWGVEAWYGGTVTVKGDAIMDSNDWEPGSFAVIAKGAGTEVTVKNATALTRGGAAYAEDGGVINIELNATSKVTGGVSVGPNGTINVGGSSTATGGAWGAMSWGSGGVIDIAGDVTATGTGNTDEDGQGIGAAPGSFITVGGSVTAHNVYVAVNSWGGTVIVRGDVEATAAGSYGVQAINGNAKVYVYGDIEGVAADIRVGSENSDRFVEYSAGSPERQVEILDATGWVIWDEYSDRFINPGATNVVYKNTPVQSGTPSITTTTLPGGYIGASYDEQITATGGAIRWSLTSGALPGGLLFDAAAGTITGIPTATGTFTFTVTASNNRGFAQRQFTVTIENLPLVELAFNGVASGTLAVTYGDTGIAQTATVTVPGSYTGSVTYASSDEDVATVDPSTGAVTTVGAGTATITATAAQVDGYAPGTASYELVVSKKAVAVTIDDASKIYGDPNPAFGFTVSGSPLVGTDDEGALAITFSTAATAASNAGSYAITGTSSSANYDVTITDGTLTVNKRPISVTGAVAASRVYDGTLSTNASSVTFDGLLSGETLVQGTDFTAVGEFIDKDAGTNKSVTVTVTLNTTAKANNYEFASAGSDEKSATASIFRRALAFDAVRTTVPSKVFDGTTVVDGASVAVVFTGLAGSEEMTNGDDYTVTGIYANANAGTKNATLTVAWIADGPVSRNYTLSVASTFTKTGCVIDKMPVPAPTNPQTGLDAANNNLFSFTAVPGFPALGDYQFRRLDAGVWTAWTNLTATNAGISGEIITIRLGNVAVVEDGIEVRVREMTNNLAGNVLTNGSDALAVNLTGTVTINGTPVYGNTLTATVASTNLPATAERHFRWEADGALVDEGVGVSSYVIEAADIGKAITVTVTTTDTNFPGARVSNPTAPVARKTVTPTVTAANKEYDGTVNAGLTFSFPDSGVNALVGSDIVTVTAPGTFDNANVGTGKTVTVGVLSPGGANAGNYIINPPANPRANITQKELKVTIYDDYEKVYGEADPAFGFRFEGNVDGETPAFTGAIARATPTVHNVGTYAVNRGTLNIANGNVTNGGSPNFLAANYRLNVVPGKLEIKPADYTYIVPSAQTISQNAAISAIPTPTGAGVGTETVSGTLNWYLSSDTDGAPLARTDADQFKSTGTVTLYWKFVPASANYVTKNGGPVTFTIQTATVPALAWVSPTVAPAITRGQIIRTYGDATPATANPNTFTKTAAAGNYTVTYSSSDTTVATVNGTTGAVTVLKQGTAIITATAADIGASISYELVVNPKLLTIASSGNTAPTKVFDGTTTITGGTPVLGLSGVVAGDEGTVSIAGSFEAVWSSANAGTRTINVSNITLAGAKNENYHIASRQNGVAVDGGGITAASISGATITVNGFASTTYNGQVQTPVAAAVAVTLGGRVLTQSTDYTVTIGAATGNSGRNAGTVTVTVTGRGNYAGTPNTARLDYEIQGSSNYTYSIASTQNIAQTSLLSSVAVPPNTGIGIGINGENVPGTLKWYASETDRDEDENRLDAATYVFSASTTLWWRYTPTSTNYTHRDGSVAFTATAPIEQNIRFAMPSANVTYGDASNSFTNAAANLTPGGGAISYSVTAGDDVAGVNANTGVVTIKKAGTATITATAAGGNGFAEKTASYILTVGKRPLTIAATGSTAPTKPYDGTTAITGPVTLNLTGWFGTDFSGGRVAVDTVSAVWSSPNAGTKAIDVTGVTFKTGANGDLSDCYIVIPQRLVAVTGNGITAAPITGAAVTVYDGTNRTYDGLPQIPAPGDVKVELGGKELVFGVDYTYSIASTNSAVNATLRTSAGTNVGRVTVRIAGAGNYMSSGASGTVDAFYAIAPASYTVSVSGATDPVVVARNTPAANIPVTRTATGITVAGVQETVNMGTFTWHGSEDDAENGRSALTSPFDADGLKSLWWRFVPATTGVAANYIADATSAAAAARWGEVEFDVIPAQQTLTWSTAAPAIVNIEGTPTVTRTYGEAGFTKAATRTPATGGGTLTYHSSNTNVATVASNGAVTVYNAGRTTITVTAAAAGIYEAASISYELVVNPKVLTIGTATTGGMPALGNGALNINSAPTKEYDGTTVITGGMPTLNLVGISSTDISGVTIRSVDAEWSGPNVNVNKINVYSVTLGGIKGGNYTVTPRNEVTVAGKIDYRSIGRAPVTVSGTLTYSGRAPMPHPDDVSVRIAGEELEYGLDYTYTVSGKDVPGADIIVTGRGNYIGTARGTLSIGPADYTYAIPGLQIMWSGATVDDIAAPATGAGVNAERVSGRLTWHTSYNDSLTGMNPMAAGSTIASGTQALWWRFMPDSANYNGAKTGTVSLSADTQPLAFTFPGTIERTYGDISFDNRVTDASAAGKNNVRYSSSDNEIVSVDSETGTVTIRRAGTAVITAIADGTAPVSYTLVVNRKELKPAGTGHTANSKQYDGDTSVTGVKPALTGWVGDDFTAGRVSVDENSVIAEWTNKNALTRTIHIKDFDLTGEMAGSYFVSNPVMNNVTLTAGSITKADITVTPDSDLGKDFSSPAVADPAGYLSYTWTGVAPMETPRFTGTLTRATPTVHNVGSYLISKGTLAIANGVAGTETASFSISNYELKFDTNPVFFEIRHNPNAVTLREIEREVQYNDLSPKSVPLITGELANIPGYLATDATTANKLIFSTPIVTGDNIIRPDSVAVTGTGAARALTYALANGAAPGDEAVIKLTVSGFTNLEPVTIEVTVKAIDFLGRVFFKEPGPGGKEISDLTIVRGDRSRDCNLEDYISMYPADFPWRDYYIPSFNAVNNTAIQLTAAGELTVKTPATPAAPVNVSVTATLRAKATLDNGTPNPFAGETHTATMTIKVIAGMQNVTLGSTTVNVNGDVTLLQGRTFTRTVTYTPVNAATVSVEWRAVDPDSIDLDNIDLDNALDSDVVSVNPVTGLVTAGNKPGRAVIVLKVVPQDYDFSVTSGANAGKAAEAQNEGGFIRYYTVFVPTAAVDILNEDAGDEIVTGKLLFAVPDAPSTAAVKYPDGPATSNVIYPDGPVSPYVNSIDFGISGIASNETVVWTTSNANIARVDSDGVVTAGNTAGIATITASVRLKNTTTGAATATVSRTATVRVQVFIPAMTIAIPGFSGTATPANPTVIETGRTRTLTASVNMATMPGSTARIYPANPTTTGVTWSIAEETPKVFDEVTGKWVDGTTATTLPENTMTGTVATVSASGVVTGRSPGMAVIRATTRPDLTGKRIYEDFEVEVETPVTALALSHRNAFTLSTAGAGSNGAGDIPGNITGNEWSESWNETVVSAIKNGGGVVSKHETITWTLSRYDILELVDPDSNSANLPGEPFVGDSVKVRVKSGVTLSANTPVTLTATREQMALPFATAALRASVSITVTNSPIVNVSSVRISNAVPHERERAAATLIRVGTGAFMDEYPYNHYMNPLKTGTTFTPTVVYAPTNASNRNVEWSARWADGNSDGSHGSVYDYIRLNSNTGAVTGLKSTGGRLVAIEGISVGSITTENPGGIKVTTTLPASPTLPASTVEGYTFAVVQRATRVTLSAWRGAIQLQTPVTLRHNDPLADTITVKPDIEPLGIPWEDVAQIVWGPARTATGVADVTPVPVTRTDGSVVFESATVKANKPGNITVTVGVITKDNVRVNGTLAVAVHMPAERIVIRNPAGTAVTLPANHRNNPFVMASGSAVALVATVNGAITASAADPARGIDAVEAQPALTAATNRDIVWYIEQYSDGTYTTKVGDTVEAKTAAAVSIGGVASITNAGRVTAIGNGWVKVIATSKENPAVKAEVFIKCEVRATTLRMQQTAFSMRSGETVTLNVLTTPELKNLSDNEKQFMWYTNANNNIMTGTAITGYVLSYETETANVFEYMPVTTNPATVPGVTLDGGSITIRAGALPAGVNSRAVTVTVRTASGRTASVVITVTRPTGETGAAQEVINMRTNKPVTWIQQGRFETLSAVFNSGINPETRRAWAAPGNRNVNWDVVEEYLWDNTAKTWSIVAPEGSVAVVDPTGRVTAVGVGMAVVEASSHEKPGITGRCIVYCMARP